MPELILSIMGSDQWNAQIDEAQATTPIRSCIKSETCQSEALASPRRSLVSLLTRLAHRPLLQRNQASRARARVGLLKPLKPRAADAKEVGQVARGIKGWTRGAKQRKPST